jgi:RNA polymerase sigma-70 factor (ECF subfamily)
MDVSIFKCPVWTFQVNIWIRMMTRIRVDFSNVLETYQKRVYQQAYRMLGNRQDAEEATQDIFLKIHGALPGFRGESKLSSWIYRITANVCISRLRKKQLQVVDFDGANATDRRFRGYALGKVERDPEEKVEANEIGDIVREELRRLPPLWVQVISLHYFGGQSYEEVAAILDIPLPTVATYISRGKQQLARFITARIGKESIYLK